MTAAMSRIGQLLLILSLPAAIMGASFISWGGLAILIFAPVASTLMQLALSRSREFLADVGAVELTGDPLGLACALEKLERTQISSFWQRVLIPYRVLEPTVLRTHPATHERIKRLETLAEIEGSATFPVHSPGEPPLGRRVPPEPQDFPRIRSGPRWHVSGLRY